MGRFQAAFDDGMRGRMNARMRQPEKLSYCAFKLKAHTKGSLKAEKWFSGCLYAGR
jgi:hypothetical protein